MGKHSFKRRFGEAYIKYKMRVARGSTFTSEIDSLINNLQRAGVVALVVSTYFHYLMPIWVLPALWLGQKLFEYFAGYYDEKHLKWWHFENEYQSRNLNPWNAEVLERLKNIEKNLK